MNTGQMLLVLFALILFSTIMVSTLNNINDLTYLTYNTLLTMQGQRIIDRYFQEIDCAILSGNMIFSEIDSYNGRSEIFNINGIPYNISITTSYSDSLGNTSFPDSAYQKVDFSVWCKAVMRDTLWIGTEEHPITRMYAKMGF